MNIKERKSYRFFSYFFVVLSVDSGNFFSSLFNHFLKFSFKQNEIFLKMRAQLTCA